MRSLVTRCFVVIIIVFVGAMIASSFAQESKVTKVTEETEFFVDDVPNTKQPYERTFSVHDGSVELYHGDELYWAWDDTKISDDTSVRTLSEENWLFVAQDGQKVWLLKREGVELIAENGYLFCHDFYDETADAVWIVQDGKLSYMMLYPFCKEYSEPVAIETDVEIAEICNRYALKDINGDYYAYKYRGWRHVLKEGEDNTITFKTFRLGKGHVLESDVERLEKDYDFIDGFQNKYNMHDFW